MEIIEPVYCVKPGCLLSTAFLVAAQSGAPVEHRVCPSHLVWALTQSAVSEAPWCGVSDQAAVVRAHSGHTKRQPPLPDPASVNPAPHRQRPDEHGPGEGPEEQPTVVDDQSAEPTYTVWVHDGAKNVHAPYPLMGLTADRVVARLGQLPDWTRTVYVTDEQSRREVYVGYLDHTATKAQERVVLDNPIRPESWTVQPAPEPAQRGPTQ